MTSYVQATSEIRPFESGGEIDVPHQEPAWIARLTPKMKQRILRQGLPLLTIPFVIDALRRDLDQLAAPPPVTAPPPSPQENR
jgi:hypothetical protein